MHDMQQPPAQGGGKGHDLTVHDRQRIAVSGVSEVVSFDESEVVLRTSRGMMTVDGDGLHVSALDIDRGELILDGTVNGIRYDGDGSERSGFLARLFG